MGKKSGPEAPTPPDPRVVAQAQGQYNREAAVTQANLNRIDQYTPQGSITYSQTGMNSDGTPQFRQDQTYSPEQQALYDQQNNIAQQLGGLAQENMGRVATTQRQDFNYNGMTPMVTGVQGGQQATQQYTGGQPGVQRSVQPAGAIQTTFGTGGPIQRGLDYSGQPQLPGAQDFGAEAQRVAGSVYGQATSRLDPQFQQQQSDLTARLANSGIAQGSEAYNREMDNFSRNRNDAYNQANFSAIQAGGQEQSRIFGLGMQARQQGVNETNQQGEFANQAQAQQYAQNQGAASFGNQAQDQQFNQNLGTGEFYNNSGNQQLAQALQALGFNNQAGAQTFNENMANANLSNAARQQQIQEATYLRNMPLNDIASLLGTGGGVQNPTFQSVSQVGVAAPDYQGAAYNTFNAQNSQYLQQQANRSAMMGQIFGAVGGLGAAAISDVRAKDRIVRIGTLANGLATYAFNYIGQKTRQFGVMAQEALGIVPDAVIETPAGYLVDYGKVW
jgi:hypothetical protein